MTPGDIVLVKFPFSDLESSKKRPTLLLTSPLDIKQNVSISTIAMITSKIESLQLPGDYQIENWSQANLLHPSLLRLSKIATVETQLISKTLGKLNDKDIKKVKKLLKAQFSFWL